MANAVPLLLLPEVQKAVGEHRPRRESSCRQIGFGQHHRRGRPAGLTSFTSGSWISVVPIGTSLPHPCHEFRYKLKDVTAVAFQAHLRSTLR